METKRTIRIFNSFAEKDLYKKQLLSTMKFDTLLTVLEDGIFYITINRPDKLNALNNDVLNDLDKALDEIADNREIKSAIITGAGPKAFVAGADISEFNGLDKTAGMALAKRG